MRTSGKGKLHHGLFSTLRYITLTRSAAICAAVVVFALLFSLICASDADIILGVSGTPRLLPFYCFTQTEKIASLSFDAAWGNEDTQRLIDILAKYKVHATFFVVGEWADKYPDSVKALAAAGHEIMNHSATHPHMPQLSREKMVEQISVCNDKIEALTGKRPTLFRAPYGDYDNTLIEVCRSLGMSCIQWDVDSLDWKDYDADKIYNRVVSRVSPGSVCLFHNAALHTPEALPSIIEKLQSDGYTLVPVSAQLAEGITSVNHEGRQQG